MNNHQGTIAAQGLQGLALGFASEQRLQLVEIGFGVRRWGGIRKRLTAQTLSDLPPQHRKIVQMIEQLQGTDLRALLV